MIILICGKSMVGKNVISEKLESMICSDKCFILRLTEPMIKHYADEKNIDTDDVCKDTKVRDEYKKAVIHWANNIRSKDPHYFCKAACVKARKKLIWIVGDVKKMADIIYFRHRFGDKVKLVRINCDDKVRAARGWSHEQDLGQLEYELENYKKWDLEIYNNDEESFQDGLKNVLKFIEIFC